MPTIEHNTLIIDGCVLENMEDSDSMDRFKKYLHLNYFLALGIAELYRCEGFNGIEKLYKKITQHLMFNIHEIDDDYDVFVAFETMNNRGKKLTNLELLKNRLIYLTTLFPDSEFDALEKENLRNEINDAWKEVYYQLGNMFTSFPHHS